MKLIKVSGFWGDTGNAIKEVISPSPSPSPSPSQEYQRGESLRKRREQEFLRRQQKSDYAERLYQEYNNYKEAIVNIGESIKEKEHLNGGQEGLISTFNQKKLELRKWLSRSDGTESRVPRGTILQEYGPSEYKFESEFRERALKASAITQKDRDGRFYDQQYSDDEGEWNVPDISDYAKKNGRKVSIPINKLLNNLEPSPYEKPEDIPGSPEFIERANESNLSYPLIVVKYTDGLFIADGVHRLWKAKSQGLDSVNAYLISDSELHTIEN